MVCIHHCQMRSRSCLLHTRCNLWHQCQLQNGQGCSQRTQFAQVPQTGPLRTSHKTRSLAWPGSGQQCNWCKRAGLSHLRTGLRHKRCNCVHQMQVLRDPGRMRHSGHACQHHIGHARCLLRTSAPRTTGTLVALFAPGMCQQRTLCTPSVPPPAACSPRHTARTQQRRPLLCWSQRDKPCNSVHHRRVCACPQRTQRAARRRPHSSSQRCKLSMCRQTRNAPHYRQRSGLRFVALLQPRTWHNRPQC